MGKNEYVPDADSRQTPYHRATYLSQVAAADQQPQAVDRVEVRDGVVRERRNVHLREPRRPARVRVHGPRRYRALHHSLPAPYNRGGHNRTTARGSAPSLNILTYATALLQNYVIDARTYFVHRPRRQADRATCYALACSCSKLRRGGRRVYPCLSGKKLLALPRVAWRRLQQKLLLLGCAGPDEGRGEVRRSEDGRGSKLDVRGPAHGPLRDAGRLWGPCGADRVGRQRDGPPKRADPFEGDV